MTILITVTAIGLSILTVNPIPLLIGAAFLSFAGRHDAVARDDAAAAAPVAPIAQTTPEDNTGDDTARMWMNIALVILLTLVVAVLLVAAVPHR